MNADLQVCDVVTAEATRPLVIVVRSVFRLDQVSSQMAILGVSFVGALKAIKGQLAASRASWLLLLLCHIFSVIN